MHALTMVLSLCYSCEDFVYYKFVCHKWFNKTIKLLGSILNFLNQIKGCYYSQLIRCWWRKMQFQVFLDLHHNCKACLRCFIWNVRKLSFIILGRLNIFLYLFSYSTQPILPNVKFSLNSREMRVNIKWN